MLELIKNSMRATVDFHGLDEMDNNPIRVVIADGEGNEVGSKSQAMAVETIAFCTSCALREYEETLCGEEVADCCPAM